MNPIRPEDSLITYPCDFPIKVMGRAHDDFARAEIRRPLRPFDRVHSRELAEAARRDFVS